MRWERNVEPRPALLVLPPAAASLDEAHGAIELWEYYSHKTLDPPQRLAVEVMMAESSSGRWAARTTGREMPRQNGKGDEVEVVELWGLTQRGEAILHTAHELFTVAGAHQRMVALLSHRDFSGKRKPKILNGLGQQSIAMGDSIVQYRTRTAGGGRGLDDISRLFVDEAQHARPEQLASATPTLLANPNPQMNFAGTGGIAGVSAWWWDMRRRALGSTPGDFGYVGHTCEHVYLDDEGRIVQEPVDPFDRSKWPGANPALVYGRTDVEFLEEQLQILGPALFAREHLGVWDPPPVDDADNVWQVIAADEWTARLDATAQPGAKVAWSIDVSPDGKSAAIGLSDGSYVEVADYPARYGVGCSSTQRATPTPRVQRGRVGRHGTGRDAAVGARRFWGAVPEGDAARTRASVRRVPDIGHRLGPRASGSTAVDRSGEAGGTPLRGRRVAVDPLEIDGRHLPAGCGDDRQMGCQSGSQIPSGRGDDSRRRQLTATTFDESPCRRNRSARSARC
jgi:hypothetical protein